MNIIVQLIEKIGPLGVPMNGFTKEVNLISWNKGVPKIDIRAWDPSHKRMMRGFCAVPEVIEKMVADYKAWNGRCLAEPIRYEEYTFDGDLVSEGNIRAQISKIPSEGLMTDQLNLVSWNGRTSWFDLRSWNDDYSRASRAGISLSMEQMDNLCSLFQHWSTTSLWETGAVL